MSGSGQVQACDFELQARSDFKMKPVYKSAPNHCGGVEMSQQCYK